MELQTLQADLAQYTGTVNYYRHPLGLLYTDGVKGLAEAAGAFWLIDLVASHQPKARRYESLRAFQLWRLTVSDDATATAACHADSNEPPAICQQIPFTDFPVGLFECYVINGVMLLKSEY